MKKYNIIGDIHGRRNWEVLIDPSRINIFCGDYFDPYDLLEFEDLKQNFLNIIQFAKTNPDTVLLLGNHDLHYIHYKDESRLDHVHAKEIEQLFMDNMHLFNGVAYALNEHILVSHSGVTAEWLESTEYPGRLEDDSAFRIAEWTNSLFWDGYVETSDGQRYWGNGSQALYHFTFQAKAKMSDYYGISPMQSPVWVRPGTLDTFNALPHGMQIVAHTQVKYISVNNDNQHIILVDCLGQVTESLYVDVDGEVCTYGVNKHSYDEH